MLWIIVRMYAGRHLEIQGESGFHQHYPWQDKYPSDGRQWKTSATTEISGLRSNLIPGEDRSKLISSTIRDYLTRNEVLMLICKEEANTFGLYPGATGIIQSTDKPHKRGPQYALGCYP